MKKNLSLKAITFIIKVYNKYKNQGKFWFRKKVKKKKIENADYFSERKKITESKDSGLYL